MADDSRQLTGGRGDEGALPPPKSLQAVIGALLFGAKAPLTVAELRATLQQVGEQAEPGTPAAEYAAISPRQIRSYLEDIASALTHSDLGLRLCEEDGRFSLRTIPEAAPWLRALLHTEAPQRLSRAALETLAIIAYRQPISRAEIESVRGVSVDHTVRALLELSLVRTVGRSELPGRPFLYGTTATFLEHFGLASLEDLPR
ncbi:MAG: SMC-Scp complex subunit ScpB [Lentisphaeraceae bacterium]|nr:SMC-Scp complex subunit ScpB [Lentisphaeraceae bacterium]